ncbi:Pectate lyase C [Mycena indigotica]|uniref:Pectate lyase n=1 Tax=Mycena indigotica TaxID=2126181 RepID=A0A8H6T5F9_9AGAR|nr:Pectate lyase C [Mycena indigotica]KAF7309760.1 Pectate lyase C [Mycena indigotica]
MYLTSTTAVLATPIANGTFVEKRSATNVWPTAPTTSSLSSAKRIAAGTTFTPSAAYTRFDRGSGACKGQNEGGDSDAVFLLEEGATLSRVIIGANQAEGVHCLGSCTLDHVYFEDVCEDAITIKQTSSSAVSRINYGGAKNADDKIVQHNGAGTVIINSFYAEKFGKLYRSCGNCKTQYTRHVEINDVWAVSVSANGSTLAGINTNYGDTAKIRTTKISGLSVNNACTKYTGNNSGAEPTKTGSGPDSQYCLYSSSDITTA